MFDFLSELLSDKKGGTIFRCFDIWHLCFIAFFVAILIFAALHIKKMDGESRQKAITTFVNIAFGLYVADFFLMPFAYGQIDVEKLPFHVCTTMCVMCFFSRYNKIVKRFKLQFAMLGFLSNLTYLIYPAGMMWHGIHPLSYRVVQTLLFHGTMMVYGGLVLIYERQEFCWRKVYKDLIVVIAMTVWARTGNALYNNSSRMYNWFFVVRDPFEMFPEYISPYVMPIINIVLFYGAGLLIYLIASGLFDGKELAKATKGNP